MPSRTPPTARRGRRRRTIIIVSLCLAAIAGGIVGGLTLANKPSPPIETLVTVSPDGKFIASGAFQGNSVFIRNTATDSLAATLTEPSPDTAGIRDFTISPDSKTIAVAWFFGPITIWSLTTGRVVTTISDTRTDGPYCIALSPDGKTMAVCGSSNTNVYLVDIASGRIDATLHPTSSTCGGAGGATFSPDGKVLAVSALSCSAEPSSVQIWNVSTKRIVSTADGIYPLHYSHNGRMLVADSTVINIGDHDALGFSWQIPDGYQLLPVAFSPDDKTLAAGNTDGTVFLWDVASGQKISTLYGDDSEITGLAYFPDGKMLVTANGKGEIAVWNLAAGEVTTTLNDPSS